MGCDPDADFVPVVRVLNIPLALVVPAKSPFQSLGDLIAEARKNPGKVNFASAGGGSPGHLAAETLAFRTKTKMTHVPYKGAGPALADVVGGHVDFYFAGVTAVVPHLKAGTIRVLALSSAARSPLLPDLPTMAELGLKSEPGLSPSRGEGAAQFRMVGCGGEHPGAVRGLREVRGRQVPDRGEGSGLRRPVTR